MNKKKEHVRIQKQVWENYTRYLIINEGASVQLELHNQTAWFGGKAFIYALWTDPEYRRKGYAEKLMKIAEKIAFDHGHVVIFLEWDNSNKRHVLDWYHRSGYVDMGYPRGCLLLSKILKVNQNEIKNQSCPTSEKMV